MESDPPRRKVLIIEEETAIRNLLYFLRANLGSGYDADCGAEHVLWAFGRETFDRILLDLRYSNSCPGLAPSKIRDLRPNLMGRVLVVSGELTDPATARLLDGYCLPRVRHKQVFENVWGRLRSLLRTSKASSPKALPQRLR